MIRPSMKYPEALRASIHDSRRNKDSLLGNNVLGQRELLRIPSQPSYSTGHLACKLAFESLPTHTSYSRASCSHFRSAALQ